MVASRYIYATFINASYIVNTGSLKNSNILEIVFDWKTFFTGNPLLENTDLLENSVWLELVLLENRVWTNNLLFENRIS